MGEKVTLDLPEEAEPVLELLPDADLLAVCEESMSAGEEEELTDLLDRKREGELGTKESSRLDELMRTYRAGLVRKAQALTVAVQRGLRPGLN